MWQEYISVVNVEEALQTLDRKKEKARIIAGGTDLILEMERGQRSDVDTLIDINRLPGSYEIHYGEDDFLHIGPNATHHHVLSSKLIWEMAAPLAQACWQVGAPQIRNRGTVAGNLITASPANDTIPVLQVLDASVVLSSLRGQRTVALRDFYTGVRRTIMQPDEMLTDIVIPPMSQDEFGSFQKMGLRKAQAIAVVNAAVLLRLVEGTVEEARICLGSVAPVIVHAREAEEYLMGKHLNDETIREAGDLAVKAASPIDDVRSSGVYRTEQVKVCVRRALHQIHSGDFPREISPVLLWGDNLLGEPAPLTSSHTSPAPIETTINGKDYRFEKGHHLTLLDLIREEAGLTGTKEGCGEGECGACTVYMDGLAVMSCLIPAPRAHGATIVTIEGMSTEEVLHPIQQSFIDLGAVQCGYCTPGFIMASAKLLEEIPEPSREQIREAISGNLCRCTGYYKIIQAIESAVKKGGYQ